MAASDDDFDIDNIRRQMANEERWESWLDSIEAFDRAEKQPGRRNGPIGHVGVSIARVLAGECDRGNLVRMKPEELASEAALSHSAVKRALKRLAACGYVAYEPGARGRKAAYRLKFPEGAQS